MDERALRAVIRLRRLTVDEARATLAVQIAAEEEAARGAAVAEDALVRERIAAEDLQGGDAMVEAFAAWLPEGRRAAADARERQAKALARVSQARAELAAARAAAEAAELLLEGHEARRREARARQEQAQFDEAGAGRARSAQDRP